MSQRPQTDTGGAGGEQPDRLDSWKEIAAYLHRNVRTVQRWERREGLPVQRHLHEKLGSIYAFRGELDAWRLARGRHTPAAAGTGDGRVPGPAGEVSATLDVSGVEPALASLPPNRPKLRLVRVLAGSLLAATVIVAAVVTNSHGRAPVVSVPRVTSLVVLPLANLSGDPAQDLLAAGLTEELTSQLAQLAGLRVVSGTTALSLRNRHLAVPDVARELHVDAVLEGSVRHEAGRIRISLQLIQASTDTHLWARDFERAVGSGLALQADVARTVVEEIRVHLPSRGATVDTRHRVRPAAREEYLRGRMLLWKFVEEDRVRAIEHFTRAIELDPGYAEPFAGLAHAWWARGVLGPLQLREVAYPARAAADRALTLDDRLAEAYAAKAYVQGMFDWDWPAAEATIRRGLAADPHSLEARYVYALLLMALGRLDESIVQIEEAARLDPLSVQVQSTFGRILYRARRFEEATAKLTRALALDPEHAISHSRLGDVYAAMGRYDQALSVFQRAGTILGPDAANRSIARVYARMGRTQQAAALVSPPTADVYAALGDRDGAFARLFRAVDERNEWPIFIKRDPIYDGLHQDPRWNELLRRMNLPIG